MAQINFTGFESGVIAEAYSSSGTVSIVASPVHTGNYSLRVNPTTTGTGYAEIGAYTAYAAPSLYSVAGSVYHTFYFRPDLLPASANEEIAMFMRVGLCRMTIRITSTGHLQLYGNDGVTQLGSDGATALTVGGYYRIDMMVGVGNPSNYELKINGSVELSGSANLNTNQNTALRLGKVSDRNGQSVDFYYDDVNIDNAAYPANAIGVARLNANGDGTYNTCTIGAGALPKWSNVDEVPHDSDTTYLLTDGVYNHLHSVNMQSCNDVGISGNVIKGVLTMLMVKNGQCTMFVRTNGNNYGTTSGGGGVAYGPIALLKELNPFTGVAWTEAEVDAAEAGIRGISANKVNWTAAYLMVEYELPVPAGQGQVI